ncbi:MAG: arginine repressor [Clostridiales bacterium]|nr:arginine repressor [Clostridiales bacterium]
MKSSRQVAILEIINNQTVETQEELAEELGKRGFRVTQATVSRDIKEMKLIKVQAAGGSYRYALADNADSSISERLIRMFSDTVLSMTSAYNQIILKTISASANIAAEAIDSMRWPEILGTIAGDNTILLIVRTIEEVPEVQERLSAMMHR